MHVAAGYSSTTLALRNNNLRQFKLLGPDVGFDSINDRPMAEELSKLLSKQNEENLLPKPFCTA